MKAKTYYEEVAETFIKALEQNTAPWQKPWKAGAGVGEEYNAKTGVAYKGINQLMLSLNNPTGGEDPRWMTFKQAQEEGYKVKKGAKGVQIVHFKFEDKRLVRDEETGEPILDKDGKKQYETVKLEKPIMSVSYVFHASQIEGMPELKKQTEIRPEDIAKSNALAEAIIKNAPVPIKHDRGDEAFYSIASDTIHLPKREQFKSIEGYYGTVIHELAHSTGHPSRWHTGKPRFDGRAPSSEDYAREELRAEIASYTLAKRHGIEHDPENHKAYVKSWINVLKNDPKEIVAAARDAEKIATMVYDLSLSKEKEVAKPMEKDAAKEPTKAVNTAKPISAGRPQRHKDDYIYEAGVIYESFYDNNSFNRTPTRHAQNIVDKEQEIANIRFKFARLIKAAGIQTSVSPQISNDGTVHRIPTPDGKGTAGVYELRPDGKGILMNFNNKQTIYWDYNKEGVLKTVRNDKRQEQYLAPGKLPALIKAPLEGRYKTMGIEPKKTIGIER